MACLIAILGYTSVTIADHGLNLLPVFFGDMAKMAWPGQFNLDFMTFLMLAGIWVSWRHQFSPAGLALGVIAVFGGMLFMSGLSAGAQLQDPWRYQRRFFSAKDVPAKCDCVAGSRHKKILARPSALTSFFVVERPGIEPGSYGIPSRLLRAQFAMSLLGSPAHANKSG